LLEEASAQIASRAAAFAHARERILAAPAPRLLDTLLEESPGIDCAALLDSSLIVREASGLERGFVGCVAPAGALDEEVARTRMGLSVRVAVTDPRLARSAVAQRALRALPAPRLRRRSRLARRRGSIADPWPREPCRSFARTGLAAALLRAGDATQRRAPGNGLGARRARLRPRFRARNGCGAQGA